MEKKDSTIAQSQDLLADRLDQDSLLQVVRRLVGLETEVVDLRARVASLEAVQEPGDNAESSEGEFRACGTCVYDRPDGDCQLFHGDGALPDPVVAWTDEQNWNESFGGAPLNPTRSCPGWTP
jgi:hypothetical protein